MENIVSADTSSQQSFDIDMSVLNDPQIETPAENSQTSNVHTNDDESITIDERFKDLPEAEARIRTLQSIKDKYRADYDKLMKDYSEKEKIANFVEQMVEDENLLYAFIREIKPELVKPIDLGVQLKEQLQKEFGADYKPQLTRDEAERDDPFGTDARYYMRVDQLKAKLLQQGGQENLTIKEYLAKKKQAEELEAKKYEMERQEVKSQYKMTDEEVKAVSEWALKLRFKDLVEVHRFLRKLNRTPNINQVPGSTPGIKSEREKFLNSIF